MGSRVAAGPVVARAASARPRHGASGLRGRAAHSAPRPAPCTDARSRRVEGSGVASRIAAIPWRRSRRATLARASTASSLTHGRACARRSPPWRARTLRCVAQAAWRPAPTEVPTSASRASTLDRRALSMALSAPTGTRTAQTGGPPLATRAPCWARRASARSMAAAVPPKRERDATDAARSRTTTGIARGVAHARALTLGATATCTPISGHVASARTTATRHCACSAADSAPSVCRC